MCPMRRAGMMVSSGTLAGAMNSDLGGHGGDRLWVSDRGECSTSRQRRDIGIRGFVSAWYQYISLQFWVRKPDFERVSRLETHHERYGWINGARQG